MIGHGDCHRCNMLADHINNLTVQAEITEAVPQVDRGANAGSD